VQIADMEPSRFGLFFFSSRFEDYPRTAFWLDQRPAPAGTGQRLRRGGEIHHGN